MTCTCYLDEQHCYKGRNGVVTKNGGHYATPYQEYNFMHWLLTLYEVRKH